MRENSKMYKIIMVICIILAIIFKFCNLGFFTILFVGFFPIHSLLFVYSNLKFLDACKNNKFGNIIFFACSLSFVLAYLFLPDDSGFDSDTPGHVFFGLLQSFEAVEKFGFYSMICFAINGILTLFNFGYYIRFKKQRS